MVYEEVIAESNIWIPVVDGEQIEGTVIDKIEGQYGIQLVLNSEGNEIKTPSHKVLQARLEKIEKGDKIRITYKGEVPPSIRGQNPTKIYKLEKDNPEEKVTETFEGVKLDD